MATAYWFELQTGNKTVKPSTLWVKQAAETPTATQCCACATG